MSKVPLFSGVFSGGTVISVLSLGLGVPCFSGVSYLLAYVSYFVVTVCSCSRFFLVLAAEGYYK